MFTKQSLEHRYNKLFDQVTDEVYQLGYLRDHNSMEKLVNLQEMQKKLDEMKKLLEEYMES